MQMDVLKAACSEGFRINGKLLADAVDDIESYCKMTDTILDLIMNYPSKELRKAREIINRLNRRDLYVEAGHVYCEYKEITLSEMIEEEENIHKEILQISTQLFGEEQHKTNDSHTRGQQLMDDDMIVRFEQK